MIFAQHTAAQERTAPLRNNARLQSGATAPLVDRSTRGTATLTLPFFEDFTDYDLYPNSARWADSNVYINNNMGINPPARGVATFDALDKRGRPRDTVDATRVDYSDSLTSQVFDFSIYQPSDAIYLSFFYQPQGAGFSPEPADSLMLFFRKKSGGWNNVWSAGGDTIHPFRQVILPVTDTTYLFDGFQFRFINKASINTNDDIWNIDYIRMATNRNANDTAISDLAFVSDPTNLLNDYTAMPYRHFLANPAGERANDFSTPINNHYNTNATVNYGFIARESVNNTPLAGSFSVVNIPPYNQRTVSFPNYTATAPPSNGRIVFENKFFLQSGNPNEPKANDTIIHNQIFDNYFAYDDGTAEKSYYLNLLTTLPGKTAIEFHTNVPDTLRGVAIYFGQQVPLATSKLFSIVAYKEIASVNGATRDSVLAQRDNLLPVFTDTINQLSIYRFNEPVLINPGYFYVGYIQPANSGSDSLYIGLDVNRTTANHLYYNVLDVWMNSSISGALMVRPLMGGPIIGTGIGSINAGSFVWNTYPNPAHDQLFIQQKSQFTEVSVMDIQGREMIRTSLVDGPVNIAPLAPGMYFVKLGKNGYWTSSKKILKQ